jgi:hypothetical protein
MLPSEKKEKIPVLWYSFLKKEGDSNLGFLLDGGKKKLFIIHGNAMYTHFLLVRSLIG